ncbi:MAG: hypothetical protein Q9160_006688 [Pyrenula sp. 1 TL-2023]
MSLSTYLATKYLTADSPSSGSHPKKKRKRNHGTDLTGLTITDDNDSFSFSKSHNPEDELVRPIVDSSNRSAEFRRSKKNNWKTLSTPVGDISQTPPTDHESEAANKILEAAALEADARRDAEEAQDAPMIVEEESDSRRMESGAKAGLQTAEDTRKMMRLQRERGEKKVSRPRKEEQETVYRDATGRRIDVQLRRAEARKAEEEIKRKEREEKEERGGDVQRQQKEERRKELEDAKLMNLARTADDEEMNEQLKGEDRWGDPMLKYLAKEEPSRQTKGNASRGPQKPTYKGAAQPNRYSIRPGFRWDGVDRGNGFEKEWFQARGRKERERGLEYQWQMDE